MDARTERFGVVFDACYRPLHAYARRRAGDAVADDIVAEALAVAWRRLDEIPAGQELPWLYGVARRVIANQNRGEARRERLLVRLAGERSVRAEPAASDDPSRLRAALARLRPEDQEVLRLAAWEQLGAAEIALVLGCNTNAAALRLSRARRRLRDQLTGNRSVRTSKERKVTDA